MLTQSILKRENESKSLDKKNTDDKVLVYCLGKKIHLHPKAYYIRAYDFFDIEYHYQVAEPANVLKSLNKNRYEMFHTHQEALAHAVQYYHYKEDPSGALCKAAPIMAAFVKKEVIEEKNQLDFKPRVKNQDILAVQYVDFISQLNPHIYPHGKLICDDTNKIKYYQIFLTNNELSNSALIKLMMSAISLYKKENSKFFSRYFYKKAESLAGKLCQIDAKDESIKITKEIYTICKEAFSALKPNEHKNDYSAMLSVILEQFEHVHFSKYHGYFKELSERDALKSSFAKVS